MTFEGHLTLQPEPVEITRLNEWLDKGFAQAGVAVPLADDFKLCVNEAVTNIILYAFADRSPTIPVISVKIQLRSDQAEAVLIDNGTTFNPLDWPRRDKISSLENAGTGGFGIQLMSDTAESLHYRRIDGQNHLTIRCRTGV